MIRNNKSKIIGVIYLLIGFYMLVMGMNGKGIFIEDLKDKFGLFYIGAFSSLILGALCFVADGLKRASYLSRIVVGSLFLVSGLIKANDSLGFSFKLEEYFDPSALDWSFFHDHHWSIPLAILISAGEVILGLAVLFGGFIRISSWALLGMTLFFAWLTYFTANCNDAQLIALASGEEFGHTCVTDCGCFGDALKGSVGRSLNPWESFYKDITLLFFVMIIFVQQRKIKFNQRKEDLIILPAALLFVVLVGGWLFNWWFPLLFLLICTGAYLLVKKIILSNIQVLVTAIIICLFSLSFVSYTYTYLPIKDYRGYAIGNDLNEKKNDGIAQINNNLYSYKHKETGEVLEIFQEEYLKRWKEIGENYDWISTEEIVVLEGRPASIQDFAPFQYYQNIPETLKNDSVLSISIDEKYDSYFEEFIVLKDRIYHQYDTVLAVDYLLEYYPDSIYDKIGTVEREVDASSEFRIDFTDYLFSLEKVLLIVSYDYKLSSSSGWTSMVELIRNANKNGIPVFCLSSVSNLQAKEIKQTYGLDFTYLISDPTEMKIIVRSNPGIVYLNNGFVIDKWDYNRIPNLEDLKN